ncbi:hypothetical protein [Cellulomonas sp. URHB0016]
MTRRVDGSALYVAFVRRRIAQTSTLALLGFVLAALVVGLAAVHDSAQRAVLDSVRADLGGRAYALQTGRAEVTETVRALPGAAPVQDGSGTVSAGPLAGPVLVRTTSDPSLALGVLTAGARPRVAGEALLSRRTAAALGVGIGDTIGVQVDDDRSDVTVVGLVVDPADVAASVLVRVVPPQAVDRPGIWLSDTDFYADPALRAALDSRDASYRSIGSLLEQATQNTPQLISALQLVPVGLGLLFGLVLVSVAALLSRGWRADCDSLVAAGMSRQEAWHRLVVVIAGVVVVGEVLGAAGAVSALLVLREPVSGALGQYWVGVAVPWSTVAVLVLLTAAVAAVTPSALRRGGQAVVLVRARRPRPRRLTAVGLAMAVTGAAALYLGPRPGVGPGPAEPLWIAPAGAVVLAASVPLLLVPIVLIGLAPATSALLRNLLGGLGAVAAVASVVVLGSGLWAAQTTFSANVGEAESSPLEPAGSFVISEMPDSTIATLVAVYADVGGSDVVDYRIPDESTANLRVTGTRLASCMAEQDIRTPQDLPASCFPQRAASPVNAVLLGPPGSRPLADPELLDDGKVGLLLFAAQHADARQVADTHADPDPTLGGNLPGLVVPSDGSVATTFGLRAGGTSEVVLLDFHELQPQDQFLIRAAATRLAPGAQTADGTDPTAYDRIRGLADAVSVAGAALAVVVVLAGGLGLVVGHTLARRTLVDLGALASRRRGIFVRWNAVLVVALAATVPLVALVLARDVPPDDVALGYFWLLPAAAALLASLVVGAAMSTTPAADSRE